GPEGEGDLRLTRERRVAAGEDELEALVGHRARRRHRWLLQPRDLLLVAPLASETFDPLPPRRGHEPRAWPLGHALARPVLERRDERVLHALLREVEIAEAAHEGRGEPARFLSEDGGHRVARDRDRCLALHDRAHFD